MVNRLQLMGPCLISGRSASPEMVPGPGVSEHNAEDERAKIQDAPLQGFSAIPGQIVMVFVD